MKQSEVITISVVFMTAFKEAVQFLSDQELAQEHLNYYHIKIQYKTVQIQIQHYLLILSYVLDVFKMYKMFDS